MCWADILLFFHSKSVPIFLPIPDLVLLSQGSPEQWLFTGSSGRIMLKQQASVNHTAIKKAFTCARVCLAVVTVYSVCFAVDCLRFGFWSKCGSVMQRGQEQHALPGEHGGMRRRLFTTRPSRPSPNLSTLNPKP